MKNFYKLMLIMLLGANLLHAGDGLSQAHLVSVTPSPNSDNVAPNTSPILITNVISPQSSS